MPKYNRIFTIVIDSLGTGAMPDSEKFGDVGVDTLGHIAEHMRGLPRWKSRRAASQSSPRPATARTP